MIEEGFVVVERDKSSLRVRVEWMDGWMDG